MRDEELKKELRMASGLDLDDDDLPVGDDTSIHEMSDGFTLADVQASLLSSDEEAERAEKEDLEMEQEKARLEMEGRQRKETAERAAKAAQLLAFSDSRIVKVFTEKFQPMIAAIHGDDPQKAESIVEGAVSMLVLLGLVRDSGIDVFSREFSTEDIDLLSPHVAKRIQHNLNLLRPRGKENARLEYIKEFETVKESMGFHLRDSNGFIGLTCYEFVKGNEEFVTFRINPGIATEYSFMGENGYDNSLKSPQSMLRKALVTFEWNEISYGIIKSKKFKLENGFHPNAKKKDESKSEILVERVIREPQRLMHLNDANDAIFNGITKAAMENLNDAVALCGNFGVDPNTISAVMNASGLMFDQHSNRFVRGNLTPTQTFNQESSIQDFSKQAPQGGSLKSELSSLAQFLED